MTRRYRGSPLENLTPALQRLLLQPFNRDDPSIVELWRRYQTSRNESDFELLCNHFLPLLARIALHLKRRLPITFKEPIEELVSDGALGLANFFRTTRPIEPDLLGKFVTVSIRRALFRGRDAMEFSKRRSQAFRSLPSIRRHLARELGREATRVELIREVRRRYKNPRSYVDAINESEFRMQPICDFEKDDESRLDVADARMFDPASPMATSEAITLAFEQLSNRDRKILRDLMNERPAVATAASLGVSRERVRQLQNTILWQLRSSHKLATAAGFLPTDPPARNRRRQLPNFPGRPDPSPVAA